MANTREVTVLYQAPSGKFHEQKVSVPSGIIQGNIPAREELAREELRRYFDARLEWVASVSISDEFDPSEGIGFLLG